MEGIATSSWSTVVCFPTISEATKEIISSITKVFFRSFCLNGTVRGMINKNSALTVVIPKIAQRTHRPSTCVHDRAPCARRSSAPFLNGPNTLCAVTLSRPHHPSSDCPVHTTLDRTLPPGTCPHHPAVVTWCFPKFLGARVYIAMRRESGLRNRRESKPGSTSCSETDSRASRVVRPAVDLEGAK